MDPVPVARKLMLLLRSGTHLCAVPVEHVVEIMRPLPIIPVRGVPDFILGLAGIRGTPVPVVDPNRLVGTPGSPQTGRFVVVRAGPRRVALAVDAVAGLRGLEDAVLSELPPFLHHADMSWLESIRMMDQELLFVLESVHIVPVDTWQRFESNGVNP